MANSNPLKNSFKILLADDDYISRLLLKKMLLSFAPNVIIIEAVNGTEAIQKYKEDLPDIVIMDVFMPGMDGIEASKAIRNLPEIYQTPIIALTAGKSENEEKLCKEVGMNDFLSKPVDLDILEKMLTKYLL